MTNVTLSLPDDLVKKAKERAHKKKTSLNKLVRELIEKEVGETDSWWAEHKKLLDEIGPAPKSWKWNRDELYEDI